MIRRLLKICLITFLFINIVAWFHAYQFTHFSNNDSINRKKPEEWSFSEKLKAAIFGITQPKPKITQIPNGKYLTLRLPIGKDTLDIWQIETNELYPTIILFHGYAASKSQMVERSDSLNRCGYNTILVDFKGSGNSTGNTTSIGYYEAEQVKAVFDYYHSKIKGDIILYGISMGSVAIMRSVSEWNIQPYGLILECPFGSMLETVQARFKIMHIPTFPMSQLLVLNGGLQQGFNAFQHSPKNYAQKIKIKTLLLYGAKDNRVSIKETEEIFNQLNGQKKIKIFPNSGHEDIVSNNQVLWVKEVKDFLNKNYP